MANIIPGFNEIIKLYKEAVIKLPVLKYSWGVIAVLCILALITSLKIGTPEAFLKGGIYIIGLMFLIFIFTLIAKANNGPLKYPLYILIYAILLTITTFVIGFAVHSFTSYKFEVYNQLFGYSTAESQIIPSNDIKQSEKRYDQENENLVQKADTSSLRKDEKSYRNKSQEAQALLKALGYNIAYSDGFEGPLTTLALEDFQRKHNLQISGAADDQTLTLLRERAKKSFLRKGDRPIE